MIRREAIRWLMLAPLVACARGAGADDPAGLQRFAFTEPHMGTLFQLVLFAPEPAAAQAAAQAAFARIAELNRSLSDYDPASEVSRLGRAPAGTAVPVSPELLKLLQRSQTLAARSGGAFDVTLGPLVRLWRESRRTGRLPATDARVQARQVSGHALLALDAKASTVTLGRSGMQLDLGGIAKGFAADEALAVLRRHGFSRAMVAASGDLALGDPPWGKAGWTVELAPFGPGSGSPVVLVVANAGVSTSGDTEQHVEIEGVRYSHLIDPATGLGRTESVAVTVIANDATTSDALATTCSLLQPEQIRPLLAAEDTAVRALVFTRSADGVAQRTLYGRDPSGLVSRP